MPDPQRKSVCDKKSSAQSSRDNEEPQAELIKEPCPNLAVPVKEKDDPDGCTTSNEDSYDFCRVRPVETSGTSCTPVPKKQPELHMYKKTCPSGSACQKARPEPDPKSNKQCDDAEAVLSPCMIDYQDRMDFLEAEKKRKEEQRVKKMQKK